MGVGDEVALDQPLCLVETAKAEVEIPSPFAGAVVELGGVEGETLPVGTLLARFSQPGPEPTMVGYGHDETLDRSRRAAPAATPAAGGTPVAGGARPLAKPPVRKLAQELGVDLAQVAPASGPGGMITEDDVRRAAEGAGATAPPAGTHVVALTPVRARIAEKVATSRQRIPDATCSVTVDCSRLLAARAALDAEAKERGEEPVVTPFALICALAVQALAASPLLNATFVEEVPEVRVHDQVHLGVATSTDRGLLVVVVRDASARTVVDLSRELRRLAAAARDGTIAPAQLQGSTFTISNFGAFGLDDGIPVINHPEVAILGVGSVRPRAVVADDQVVARPTATLTLAFDHRVCDGAEAGRFLGALRDLIEGLEPTPPT